jgi:hypothetical protein
MNSGQRDDIQELLNEVAGLRAELRARADDRGLFPRAVSRVRAMRRLTVVGIVALMLAVPVAVSANHLFSDVPTSNTYHTTVARLAGAGLTGGCGGGKYCPNAAVTRGQMAAFLNRGLGRGAQEAGTTEDDDWALLMGSSPDLFPAVTYLTVGGGTGGTALVLVNGAISVTTNEAGVCPCDLRMALISEIGEISPISSTVIADLASPDDGTRRGTVSMSYLFTVPSGTEVGFAILAIILPTLTPSPENIAETDLSLQATYVPFAADGTNPSPPIVIAGEPNVPFGRWPFATTP